MLLHPGSQACSDGERVDCHRWSCDIHWYALCLVLLLSGVWVEVVVCLYKIENDESDKFTSAASVRLQASCHGTQAWCTR